MLLLIVSLYKQTMLYFALCQNVNLLKLLKNDLFFATASSVCVLLCWVLFVMYYYAKSILQLFCMVQSILIDYKRRSSDKNGLKFEKKNRLF